MVLETISQNTRIQRAILLNFYDVLDFESDFSVRAVENFLFMEAPLDQSAKFSVIDNSFSKFEDVSDECDV